MNYPCVSNGSYRTWFCFFITSTGRGLGNVTSWRNQLEFLDLQPGLWLGGGEWKGVKNLFASFNLKVFALNLKFLPPLVKKQNKTKNPTKQPLGAITTSNYENTRKQRNMYPMPRVSLCDYFALWLCALKFILEGSIKWKFPPQVTEKTDYFVFGSNMLLLFRSRERKMYSKA